ncbi:MAG TPA: hypothetical protein VIM50_04830 [Candidatus Limnocylindria bacterium]
MRIHQVGNEDRAAPPAELDRVRELCRDARGRGPADDELPARTLELDRRGLLPPAQVADLVFFDPATIQDHVTHADPHRFATGVGEVIVIGVPVLSAGARTNAGPGRVVRRPGWAGRRRACRARGPNR